MRKFDGFFSCLYVLVICWVWNKAAVLTPRRCWLTWKRALWTKSWRAHCVMCLITNSSSVMCRDQAIIGMYVSGLFLRTFLDCLLVRFRTFAVDVHNSCVIYNSVWAQNVTHHSTIACIKALIIPRTGDIYSVCLSFVRPRRFVWHFVRLTPPMVFNAQERNLWHESAVWSIFSSKMASEQD